MKNLLRKRVYAIFAISLAVVTFFACRKNFREGPAENSPVVLEAKTHLSAIVQSERSLLDMPFTQLKKNANLRRFARMGKMEAQMQWDKAQNFYRNGTSFAIVPVDDDVHHLNNPAFESVRYMLFSKRDGDKMEMNIIEMYSQRNGSLGTDIANGVKIAAENMLFNENKAIGQISASVVVYDRYYYNNTSFTIQNGNWKKARIIVENSNRKPVVASVQTHSLNGVVKSDMLKALSTVSPMSGCGICTTYYLIGIWYDMNTGEIVDTEVLDSWDECVEPNHNPQGSSPGSTVTSNNHNNNNKNINNTLNVPCLGSLLSANASRIANFVSVAQNNENIYMPMNFNFSGSSTLPSNKNGSTDAMYTDGNGILNIDISINENVLPGASREYSLRSFLHEALHGVLLSNGVAWSNTLQHEEIANSYRSLIASTLLSAYPGLGQSEADALAWEGLRTSTAWGNLPQWKRDLIDEILADHRQGNTGTGC